MAAESARIALKCEEAKVSCKLDLEKCSLRKIPDAIYLLMRGVELQCMSLAHNDITTVPSRLGLKLVTLTSQYITTLLVIVMLVFISFSVDLDLSYNHLTKLPLELGNMIALHTLKLSNNNFTDIPIVIGTFTKLHTLDMSNNQIQSIPINDLSVLNDLYFLNVSYNHLTECISFMCFPGLHEINMSHNKVTTVNYDSELAILPWLEAIDLTGNPLNDDNRDYLQSIIRIKILL